MKTTKKDTVSNRKGNTGSHIFWALAGLLLVAALGMGLSACEDSTSGPEEPQETTVSVHAEGLTAPVGIDVESEGRLWVGEQGTGQNDSRISVITTDGQVHAFLTGLPSEFIDDANSGAWRPVLSSDGSTLFIVQGEGTQSLSMSLLSVDVSGFSPGSSPLTSSDVTVEADIGTFMLDEQEFPKSNPYDMTTGPGGDHFIVDAGANAIIRRDQQTGQLSVFATFQPVPNPTNVGPPVTDAVPTGIVFTNRQIFVSGLSGFPFSDGQTNIYEVDTQGNVSIHQNRLTNIVDITVDPRDGNLVVLQIAQFDPQRGFIPNTGQILKLQDGAIDTLVTELNFSSGMQFGPSGDLFVSSLVEGTISRITFP